MFKAMEEDELWEILNEYRGKMPFDSMKGILRIISDSIESKDAFKEMVENIGLFDNGHLKELPYYSKSIYDFLGAIVAISKPDKAIDPWANLGESLKLVQENSPNTKLKGALINRDLLKWNEHTHNFDVELDDSFSFLEKNVNVDLIVSNLPIGLRTDESRFGITKSELGFQIIAQSCLSLKDGGVGIFNVTEKFTSESGNGKKLREFFKENNISVDALISTPVKSINPHASIPMQLLVLSKTPQGDVFVGKIDEGNKVHNEKLIKNYVNSKNGKTVFEGRLISFAEKKTSEQIENDKEINISLRRTALPLIKIEDVGNIKNLYRDQRNENWILIQRFYMVEVETFYSGSEKMEKIHNELSSNQMRIGINYHVLEVNPDVARVDYLVKFLNSPLGQSLRANVHVGAIMPSLTSQQLKSLTIPLPSVVDQNHIIQLSREIDNYTSFFKQLDKSLWKAPSKHTAIKKQIKNLVKDKNSIDWMEELPFPIASILWGYHSESTALKKVEYLFLFFEGLCQFIDVLLLSSISSDRSFYENEGKNWIRNEDMKHWYEKASFGGWQYMFEKLAKNVRKLFNDKDQKEMIYNAFGGPSDSFIEAVTNKKLIPVFKNVNSLRNSFKGHGGVSSDELYNSLLQNLESALYEIKDILVDGFSDVKLIHVVPNSLNWDKEEGIFESTCRFLKGTRSKFNKESVYTREPLSAKQLYIVHEGQYRAIELLPLIQLRESPKTEQNAFYFYNRIEGNSVRMVSYHFEKEAELSDSIDFLENTIKILNPKD